MGIVSLPGNIHLHVKVSLAHGPVFFMDNRAGNTRGFPMAMDIRFSARYRVPFRHLRHHDLNYRLADSLAWLLEQNRLDAVNF
jgi:hypothetical protein